MVSVFLKHLLKYEILIYLGSLNVKLIIDNPNNSSICFPEHLPCEVDLRRQICNYRYLERQLTFQHSLGNTKNISNIDVSRSGLNG